MKKNGKVAAAAALASVVLGTICCQPVSADTQLQFSDVGTGAEVRDQLMATAEGKEIAQGSCGQDTCGGTYTTPPSKTPPSAKSKSDSSKTQSKPAPKKGGSDKKTNEGSCGKSK